MGSGERSGERVSFNPKSAILLRWIHDNGWERYCNALLITQTGIQIAIRRMVYK
jgi:hypothetical protein